MINFTFYCRNRRLIGVINRLLTLIVVSEVREYDSSKLIVVSEVREYDSSKLIVSEKWKWSEVMGFWSFKSAENFWAGSV